MSLINKFLLSYNSIWKKKKNTKQCYQIEFLHYR